MSQPLGSIMAILSRLVQSSSSMAHHVEERGCPFTRDGSVERNAPLRTARARRIRTALRTGASEPSLWNDANSAGRVEPLRPEQRYRGGRAVMSLISAAAASPCGVPTPIAAKKMAACFATRTASVVPTPLGFHRVALLTP
jgi:hypothetical protein